MKRTQAWHSERTSCTDVWNSEQDNTDSPIHASICSGTMTKKASHRLDYRPQCESEAFPVLGLLPEHNGWLVWAEWMNLRASSHRVGGGFVCLVVGSEAGNLKRSCILPLSLLYPNCAGSSPILLLKAWPLYGDSRADVCANRKQKRATPIVREQRSHRILWMTANSVSFPPCQSLCWHQKPRHPSPQTRPAPPPQLMQDLSLIQGVIRAFWAWMRAGFDCVLVLVRRRESWPQYTLREQRRAALDPHRL